jgi:hypothetical protein
MAQKTLLQLAADAYRQCNLDTELTNFDTNQPFPFHLAPTLFQQVFDSLNQMGGFDFMMTETTLPTPASSPFNTWALDTLSVVPGRVVQVECVVANTRRHRLIPLPWPLFRQRFETTLDQQPPVNQPPTHWTIQGTLLKVGPMNMTTSSTQLSLVALHQALIQCPLTPSTTAPVPPGYEGILAQGLLGLLLERLGRTAESLNALARFERMARKHLTLPTFLASSKTQLPRLF